MSSKWAKGTGGPAGDECYNLTLAPAVYESHPNDSRVTGPVEQCPTAMPESRATFTSPQTGLFKQDPVSTTITRNSGAGGETQNPAWVIEPAVYESHPNDSRVTGPVERCPTVAARWGTGQPVTQFGPVAGSLLHRHDSSPCADRGANVVAVQQPMAFSISPGVNRGKQTTDDLFVAQQETSRTLDTQGANPERHQGGTVIVQQPIAMINMQGSKQKALAQVSDQSYTILAMDGNSVHAIAVQQPMAVRRLTPVECERLQGFPDGWTDIKPGGKDTPDSPRYKALGNSMAVPVMRWIGKRLQDCSIEPAN